MYPGHMRCNVLTRPGKTMGPTRHLLLEVVSSLGRLGNGCSCAQGARHTVLFQRCETEPSEPGNFRDLATPPPRPMGAFDRGPQKPLLTFPGLNAIRSETIPLSRFWWGANRPCACSHPGIIHFFSLFLGVDVSSRQPHHHHPKVPSLPCILRHSLPFHGPRLRTFCHCPSPLPPFGPLPSSRGTISRWAAIGDICNMWHTWDDACKKICGSDPKAGTDAPFIAARTRIRPPPLFLSNSRYRDIPQFPPCQRQAGGKQTLQPQLCQTRATRQYRQVLHPLTQVSRETLQYAAALIWSYPSEGCILQSTVAPT